MSSQDRSPQTLHVKYINRSPLGTRENKAKTDSEESITQMIRDKLIWMCRGCKDPVQEPAAEPVQPINEINSSSESSTEVRVKTCFLQKLFSIGNIYFYR